MPEFARKYIWLGAAGGVLQFALIALIAFGGPDEPPTPQKTPAAESRTSAQASGAPSTDRPAEASSLLEEAREKAADVSSLVSEPLNPDGFPEAEPGISTTEDDKEEPDDQGSEHTGRSEPREETTADKSKPEVEASAETKQESVPEGQISAPIDFNAATTEDLIRAIFKEEGEKAIRVALCESELKTDAQQGQFQGLFQMGANERARYGHGTDALAQIEAAYDLFVARGWQPWTCA